jgi:colanic acid/amylovoran biosynthesis protein WcaK/AmsJ
LGIEVALPRFSLIGATLYGNRGAQAMLETVIGRVRERVPAARFEIFSYLPTDDRRVLCDTSVKIHSATPLSLVAWLTPFALIFALLRRLFGSRMLRLAPSGVRALAESDAMLDVSGVSFLDGRERFLAFNVFNMLPALVLGVPVIRLPQAIGPFDGLINRIVARWSLPRCAFTWARGAQTAEYLENAAFDGLRFDRADDLAFCHKDSYRLTREGDEFVQLVGDRLLHLRGSGGRCVGVCPSSVVAAQSRREGSDYEGILVNLVSRLLERGCLVVLFPNATRSRDESSERNNDLPLIDRVAASISSARTASNLIVIDGDVDAVAIRQIIRSIDVAIVSRFHAMIGALSLAVPTAVVGWSHKYREVMAEFGQESLVIDYRELDSDALAALETSLLSSLHTISTTLSRRLPFVVASASKPIDALLEQPICRVH